MPANSVIQLRRGTAAQWTSANPVLANGEPGYETDTGKEKRGDGTTAWTSLAYVPGVSRTGSRAVGQSELVVNVKDYGAAGNGTTDDTTAIQNAINALPAGGTVLFPTGFYKVTSTITVTVPMILQGAIAGYDGSGKGSGISVTTGVNAFTCSSNRVSFRDLYFLANSTEAASISATTWGIKFTSGDFCSVERCRFTFLYYGVWFANCAYWTLRDNFFWHNSGYHVLIQNVATPDGGDQFMSGNVFQSGSTYNGGDGTWAGLAQVRQESGGGVRCVGNKFFAGPIGYQLAVADGAHTSILLLGQNSFEHQTYACVQMRGSGVSNTGTFYRTAIVGNQFTGDNCTQGVFVVELGVGNMFREVLFNSNICGGISGSTKFVVADYVAGLTITNNYFWTGLDGIRISGNSSDVWYRNNHMFGLTGVRSRNDSSQSGNHAYPTESEKTTSFTITSTASYTTGSSVAVQGPAGGSLEVWVTGFLTGGGAFSGYFSRVFSSPSSGGTVVASTVGTDTTSGVPFDILFDTTVANQINFKLKRNTGDGGSQIQGSVSTRVRGIVQTIS